MSEFDLKFRPLNLFPMRILCLSVACFLSSLTRAQVTSDNVIEDLGIDRDYFVMMTIKPDDPTVEGNQMLFDDWMACRLQTKSGKAIENVQINYNLVLDEVYLRLNGGLASIESDQVNGFTLLDLGVKYSRENFGKPSFVKVLFNGTRFKLYEYIEVMEKEPNYSVALDVGHKNYRIIKKSTLLGGENEFLDIKKKKNRKVIFGDNYESMEDFVKSNGLKWSHVDDLITIMAKAESQK